MTRPALSERALIGHVTAQRWYGSKSREISGTGVLDRIDLPGLTLALVGLEFPGGTHEIYQLVVGDDLDGLADPAVARKLVQLIRSGGSQPAGEGTIEFHHVEGFGGLGSGELSPRPIGVEQSHSSLVFDEELILKVYRRIEPGINPELEMFRFLTERNFANVPELGGWYSYLGRPLEATLGILQAYVPGAVDGWALALDELVAAPDRFLSRVGRLGEVTGELHSVLASDPDDPSFRPEESNLESLGLLTASIDEEIEQVYLLLPEDLDVLEPILGRAEDVREVLRQRTYSGTSGRLIRNHGDFHLGQTLWASDDWTIIDFEGEPARPLPERRRKRSPLRDVAGMLRSFAYAASAVELLRGTTAPSAWEEAAREQFLDGYLEAVDPEIVPEGREAVERLLSVFELEKALYELRYELTVRPDWLPIPVAGLLRILEEPATA